MDFQLAYGLVLYGFDVIHKIEKFGTVDGQPTKEVIISDCGVMDWEEYKAYMKEQKENKEKAKKDQEAKHEEL